MDLLIYYQSIIVRKIPNDDNKHVCHGAMRARFTKEAKEKILYH